MIQTLHVATQFISLQHVFQKCFSECQSKEKRLVYLSPFVLTGAHLIQIKYNSSFLVLFKFGTVKSQFIRVLLAILRIRETEKIYFANESC